MLDNLASLSALRVERTRQPQNTRGILHSVTSEDFPQRCVEGHEAILVAGDSQVQRLGELPIKVKPPTGMDDG